MVMETDSLGPVWSSGTMWVVNIFPVQCHAHWINLLGAKGVIVFVGKKGIWRVNV